MDVEGQNFEVLAQLASNSVYDLSGQLRKTRKIVSRLDSAALGREMAALGSQCAKALKVVDSVTSWPQSDLKTSELKVQSELGSQLDSLMHGVRQIQTSATEKLRKQKQQQQQQQQKQQKQKQPRQSNTSEQTPLLSGDINSGMDNSLDGSQPEMQQQQMQQQVLDELDQADLDLHGALISDRDAEIAEIQRGMREINSIFQDVGVLVTQQGQQLDTVEDNLTEIAQQAENASRQLVRADNYQRGRGKWTCIALAVLLVITILVGLNVVS